MDICRRAMRGRGCWGRMAVRHGRRSCSTSVTIVDVRLPLAYLAQEGSGLGLKRSKKDNNSYAESSKVKGQYPDHSVFIGRKWT